MEEAVVFNNESGKKLFGIVHIPKGRSHQIKTGVVLLNPGIKYRVAPHRLNVKIARRLCGEGYFVFRFDPEGIGDSEGDLLSNEKLDDIAEKIQLGVFVSDTIYANQFFFERYGLNKLILIGNCGGAITALLSSEKDKCVAGAILIDLPIQFKRSEYTFADKVVADGEISNRLLNKYLLKVISPRAWIRFFSFKTEYRALFTLLRMKVNRLIPRFKMKNGKAININTFCTQNNLNALLFNAYTSMSENGKKSFFILAGNDKSTEFFQKYFLNEFIENNKHLYNYPETFLINDANHIYTLYEWQDLLINKIAEWVGETASLNSMN